MNEGWGQPRRPEAAGRPGSSGPRSPSGNLALDVERIQAGLAETREEMRMVKLVVESTLSRQQTTLIALQKEMAAMHARLENLEANGSSGKSEPRRGSHTISPDMHMQSSPHTRRHTEDEMRIRAPRSSGSTPSSLDPSHDPSGSDISHAISRPPSRGASVFCLVRRHHPAGSFSPRRMSLTTSANETAARNGEVCMYRVDGDPAFMRGEEDLAFLISSMVRPMKYKALTSKLFSAGTETFLLSSKEGFSRSYGERNASWEEESESSSGKKADGYIGKVRAMEVDTLKERFGYRVFDNGASPKKKVDVWADSPGHVRQVLSAVNFSKLEKARSDQYGYDIDIRLPGLLPDGTPDREEREQPFELKKIPVHSRRVDDDLLRDAPEWDSRRMESGTLLVIIDKKSKDLES